MKDMQSIIGLLKQVLRDACSRTNRPGLLGHDMKDVPSSCLFVAVLYSFFSVVCLQVHVYAHVCAPTMSLPEVTLG